MQASISYSFYNFDIKPKMAKLMHSNMRRNI